jgi:hypothetical protein
MRKDYYYDNYRLTLFLILNNTSYVKDCTKKIYKDVKVVLKNQKYYHLIM